MDRVNYFLDQLEWLRTVPNLGADNAWDLYVVVSTRRDELNNHTRQPERVADYLEEDVRYFKQRVLYGGLFPHEEDFSLITWM
jgi:hypothetical protein